MLWLSVHAAFVDPAVLQDHAFVPVVLPGEMLPTLLGASLESLAVLAVHSDGTEPIPFQVDQRDRHGDWVWAVRPGPHQRASPPLEELADIDPPIPRAGDGYAQDDQDPPGAHLFDANDELVFMAKDLGGRWPGPLSALGASPVVELRVRSATFGTDGWVYIGAFHGAPAPRSARRYMHYDDLRDEVRSPIYAFRFSDTLVALIRDLRVVGKPLVDRLKVRGELVLALPPPLRRIRFDEEAISGHTEGYIAGPVRIIKRNLARLSLAGGLVKTPGVTCEHTYYPHYARVPICISLRFPVRSVRMTVTTDYRDPPFHHIYMGRYPDPQGDDWIALDTEQVSIISVLAVPEDLRTQVETRPCICYPEVGPGADRAEVRGYKGAGFAIASLPECPKGEHVLYGLYLLTPRPYEPGDERLALALRHPDVQVHVVRVWERP